MIVYDEYEYSRLYIVIHMTLIHYIQQKILPLLQYAYSFCFLQATHSTTDV
jgi:hypothetical protein